MDKAIWRQRPSLTFRPEMMEKLKNQPGLQILCDVYGLQNFYLRELREKIASTTHPGQIREYYSDLLKVVNGTTELYSHIKKLRDEGLLKAGAAQDPQLPKLMATFFESFEP